MNTWIGQVIHSHLMYRSCLLTHTLTPHTPPRTKQHTHTRTHTHRLLSLRTPFLVMLPSMLFWSPPSATRTQRRRWCLAQSRRGACEWGRRGGEYVSGGGEEGSMWVGKARKEAWELVRCEMGMVVRRVCGLGILEREGRCERQGKWFISYAAHNTGSGCAWYCHCGETRRSNWTETGECGHIRIQSASNLWQQVQMSATDSLSVTLMRPLRPCMQGACVQPKQMLE